MKEIKYQQKYVRELVDMTIDLLHRKGGAGTCVSHPCQEQTARAEL